MKKLRVMLITAGIIYSSVTHKLAQKEGMNIKYGQILKITVRIIRLGILYPHKNSDPLRIM